jgi:hypothetical protein
MALDTSALRTPDPDFPEVKDEIVTLIRITATAVTRATAEADKRALLHAAAPGDTLLAVWTGRYKSDAFAVPADLLAGWKQELP